MDKKQEALDRIAAAKREIEEAQRIIEDEDKIDLRKEWVGKWGFYSDDDPSCPDGGNLGRLINVAPGDRFRFYVSDDYWRYFRPATLEELGFQEYDEMLDFIERQTRINIEHPEYGHWSWSSLVFEAKKIIGSIK